MSSDTLPITPSRFALALKDLSISSLHLKVLELRNNIAHLDYSNEQLRPFADGTAPTSSTPQQPDPDCIDAIRENEEVISRMQERIQLVRAEVEDRGCSWTEFQSKEEADAEAGVRGEDEGSGGGEPTTNGTGVNGANGQPNVAEPRHSAWRDGTFRTGVIRGGDVHMDGVAGSGGSLTDEELRRRMEEQLRGLGDDGEEEQGLHL